MNLTHLRTAAIAFAVASTLAAGSSSALAQQTNQDRPQQTTEGQTPATAPAYSNPSQQENTQQQSDRDQAQRSRGVNSSTTDMSVPDTDAAHNWTQNQIITATVHQAWLLSGKNEANFFEIVKELAEISAHNRDLVLPDNSASGKRAGEYIKDQAKADHDQLLYAIVDKAVQMTGKPAPESADNHNSTK